MCIIQAMDAIMKMKDKVDTLIVVSNDQLLQIVPENTPLTDAFLVADDILRQGVVGISEIIIKPGLVNVDFADVRTIMGNAGTVRTLRCMHGAVMVSYMHNIAHLERLHCCVCVIGRCLVTHFNLMRCILYL